MPARRIAELVLESATDYAILTMDLAGLITFWSKGAENVFGWSEDEMLGRPAAAIFTPEDQSANIAAIEMEKAIDAGRAKDERWHLKKDGSRFWASGELLPLHDGGAPEGFLKILRDRTNQRLADVRVEREVERLRQMFEQAPGFFAMLRGPNHIFEVTNPRYLQLIGHRDVIGLPVRTALPEIVKQGFADLLDHVFRTGEAYIGASMSIDLQTAPGAPIENRLLDFVYQPVVGTDGSIEGIFVQGTDVTERHKAERMLRDIADALPVAVAMVDREQRYVFINATLSAWFGHLPSDVLGRTLREVLGDRNYAVRKEQIEKALAGERVEFEGVLVTIDGTQHTLAHQYLPRFGPHNEVEGVYITATDVSQRVRAEALQHTLNQELSHRMKNQMAMVQGLVTQTLRGATDISSARNTILDRIGVLGRAHDILIAGEGTQAPVRTVIQDAIGFAQEARVQRIRLSGPDFIMGSQAALSLALLLHELTTNAMKYGALSTDQGTISVDWNIAQVDSEELFLLHWQESGGPAVHAPERIGFGSRLIKGGISGASSKVSVEYHPSGLQCTIEASLAHMKAVD